MLKPLPHGAQNFCGFLILQFLPWYKKKMFLKKKKQNPPQKFFLKKIYFTVDEP